MPFEREQWVTLWESIVKPTIVSNKVQIEGPLTRDPGSETVRRTGQRVRGGKIKLIKFEQS